MERRKKKKKKNERDQISDLSDAILHHIFSFLSMEEAVRSSVLSKRWRHLWTSLPTLNFNFNFNFEYDDDEEELKRIVGLVDKVFFLRDGSNITRFSLNCPYLPYTSSFCSPVLGWVTSALRCNVQELVIELNFDWLWPHPRAIGSLFNSKSLTYLRLVCSAEENFLYLKLPDSVCLPSLKTLSLETVEFSDDYDMTNKLVSGCPVLESLTIRRCLFCKHINIKIASLSLKHLVFEDTWKVYVSTGCLSQGSLKLITPNLISFRCESYTSKKYYLDDISSLTKADICMRPSPEEEGYGDHGDDEYMPPEVKKKQRAQRMLKFLRAFHNVKDLILSGAILEDDSSDIKEYPEAETFSECLFDNLELVEIRDAVGCVNELYFIKLLLKNAKVLKKMVVYTSKKESPEREERMLKFTEKLLSFPKASSNITILFI